VIEVDSVRPHTEQELRNLAAVADVLPAWNAHDVTGVLGYYDPEIRWHNVALEEWYEGTEQVGEFLHRLFAAFPDLSFSVTWRICHGDEVAEEWVMEGTHLGEFFGVPGSGRTFRIVGMSRLLMRDGNFYRDEFYFDVASFLRQIGLLPSLALTNTWYGRAVVGAAVRFRRAAAAIQRFVLRMFRKETR
jgi:steroid delta-isomerase-like uncharacterized protein